MHRPRQANILLFGVESQMYNQANSADAKNMCLISSIDFMEKIRPYVPEDQKAVQNIYALSKLDELKNEKEGFELIPLENDSKRFTKLMESNIYVYYEQGVNGYCAFMINEITALFVHPVFRKRGIGISMLEFMLNILKNNAFLYVVESNVSAKQLYKKFGFEVVDDFHTEYNGKIVLANKMTMKKTS
jgi:putative acetyltransferase